MFGAPIMAAMARASEMGRAVGIRANGPDDIAAIRAATHLPIVGLWKQYTPGFEVYITPTRGDARAIALAGCHMIAVDATPRQRPMGETLASLIGFIHDELGLPVMADTSCIDDALLAQSLGADVISTTMAGYTSHGRPPMDGPDLDFLAHALRLARVPVMAEGRFNTPDQAARAMALGAHCVIVGTAITRPEVITRRFTDAIAGAG